MSLMAQGLSREVIAGVCGYTPEYITWLARQTVCKEYLKEMNEAVSVRLEAMFEKAVDTISEGMQVGTVDEKLKAARLQLETTGRLGRPRDGAAAPPPGTDHLEVLADRLVSLLKRTRERTYDGTVLEREVEDVEPISGSQGQLRSPGLQGSELEGSQS